MELPRARRPEVFAVVGLGEGVQVDDLGAIGGGDSEDGFGAQGDGEAGAWRDGARAEEGARGALDKRVEGVVEVERGVGCRGEVGGLRGRVGSRRGVLAARFWVGWGLVLWLGVGTVLG